MENTANVSVQPLNPSVNPNAVSPSSPQEWIFEIAEAARKAEDSLQNFIIENPVTCVAIAIGIGYAVNLIVKIASSPQEHL
jgi:hypothetical protein